ncbi:hypothetical protein [Sulfurimonas sp.]|uniref:hypothetical protein n=1 Tax=Sulfurimonas sp. TaxID=2022749 RepID=UPI003565B490
MRNAFSFIEVLISVMVLAFLGTALIKFNSFNKRAMERNIHSQEIILLSSAILSRENLDNEKEMDLLSLTEFKNLTNEDREFLKSITLSINKEIEDKIFLADDGNEKLYLEYGDLKVKYKDYTQNFLWMGKAK